MGITWLKTPGVFTIHEKTQKPPSSVASGFGDSHALLLALPLRQTNDLNLDSTQLYFGRFFGFSFSLKRLFKLDPWQTVVDFDPSCIGLAVTFQLRHEEPFGADH